MKVKVTPAIVAIGIGVAAVVAYVVLRVKTTLDSAASASAKADVAAGRFNDLTGSITDKLTKWLGG